MIEKEIVACICIVSFQIFTGQRCSLTVYEWRCYTVLAVYSALLAAAVGERGQGGEGVRRSVLYYASPASAAPPLYSTHTYAMFTLRLMTNCFFDHFNNKLILIFILL